MPLEDPFLDFQANMYRLSEEYKKYGSLVIAYDFDGTVHDFHKKGHTYPKVIELLHLLKEFNCYLICFTANTDKKYLTEYLTENNIPFDAINENPPFFKCDARKIYYNAYLDDRAGLRQVYGELYTLFTAAKSLLSINE